MSRGRKTTAIILFRIFFRVWFIVILIINYSISLHCGRTFMVRTVHFFRDLKSRPQFLRTNISHHCSRTFRVRLVPSSFRFAGLSGSCRTANISTHSPSTELWPIPPTAGFGLCVYSLTWRVVVPDHRFIHATVRLFMLWRDAVLSCPQLSSASATPVPTKTPTGRYLKISPI